VRLELLRELNMANETPELPLTEELMTGLPKAPKGYVGPEKLAPVIKEIQAKKATAEEELAQSDIRLEKAKREEKATEAELRKSFYEQEKAKEEAMPQRAALKQAREEISSAKFEPTRDTVKDIAGLFSLMGVVGMVVGKKNAMQGMYAMNGMMEGHIKGRNDLVKQQAVEFDKNFKVLQAKVESAKQELEEAMRLRMYDQRAGEEAIAIAVARSESPFIKESVARVGVQKTINTLNDTLKTVETMVKLQNDLQGKADERARRREDIAARERIASLRSVGSRSATSERYAGNVYRSANEVNRSLELLEQIGITTGGGALGQVVGKGTIPSEVQKYLGQALTDEQERNYNTAMSGVALEMAYVLGGGYKPDVGLQNKLETYLSVGPNDTAGTAAYKFADTVAKLKAAIEASPTYNDTQKETKETLLKKFEKYATPEVVYERAYGIAPRAEPMVRSGEPTGTQSSGGWTVREKP